MSKRPKPSGPSGISFFCVAFLEASNRNGSRGSSRRFQKESPKQRPSEINQSAFSGCFGASSAKIVSAGYLQPLISCKPLDVTSTYQQVRLLQLKAIPVN